MRCTAALLLSLAAGAGAFLVPPSLRVATPQAPWGASPSVFNQGADRRQRGALYSLIINPKRQGITQLGIEEIKAKRAALQAPEDLKGSVLVTGSLEEEVFTLLNEQRVWSKITAFAADPVSAKKRLTSRSTRYSGVLDMLSIEEGDHTDLPLLESFVKPGAYDAWLDVSADADPKRLLEKAQLAASSGLKYFITALTLTEEQIRKQDLDLEPVAKVLTTAGVKHRILVTGPVIEAPATGFVRLNDTEFLLPNATITRGDLSRIATEFFLVSEKQDAAQIYVTEGDESVIGYLRYCREQGMNYKAEITDMLQGGLHSYKDKVQALVQAEADKAAGVLSKGAKKDSEVYAAYRLNVTNAGIASEYDKKRRTLVGMVKKIVGDILEEEYDDMYYSMRTKEDLDLYKKANWGRAVSLVLGMLMGDGQGGKAKTAQRLTGFQDPYMGPQWHVIRSNAAVMVKIKELYDEIGERLTKEDWERYDILEGDFMGDEEAVLTMKIEEKTRRNKNYLRETLVAPPRRKASLVVEVEDIDVFKTALLESQAGRKGALPAAAGAGEPAALPATASVEKEAEPVAAAAPAKRGRKRKTASSDAAAEGSADDE